MSSNINQPENLDGESAKIPMTLTLRDVVFIVAAVVSMATAWGMFGTRLSVVEQKVISIGNNIIEIRLMVKDLRKEEVATNQSIQTELNRFEDRLRLIENHQARIRVLLNNKKNKIP